MRVASAAWKRPQRSRSEASPSTAAAAASRRTSTTPSRAVQITGLLGPSGCGKTTLMRAIVGVQRVAPGRVDGARRARPGRRRCAPRVGYVTQAPSVYADLTVAREPALLRARARRAAARVERAHRGRRARGRRRPAGRAALRRPARPRLARRRAARPSPSCSCSTSRPSASTPCCAATCGRLFHAPRRRRHHAARLEPRHGRGRPLRPAAADARRRAACRRHARRRCCARTGADDVEDAFLRLVEPSAGARMSPRGRSPPPRGCSRQLRRDRRTVALLLVVPCRAADAAALRLRRPAGDLRPHRRAAARDLPVRLHVPRHLDRDAARAHQRHARAADDDRRSRKLDLLLGYALAFGAVAAVQAASSARRARRCSASTSPARSRWSCSARGRQRGARHGARAVRERLRATEFQAVQFMPAFVLPQLLLCGLFVPREADGAARWRRSPRRCR